MQVGLWELLDICNRICMHSWQCRVVEQKQKDQKWNNRILFLNTSRTSGRVENVISEKSIIVSHLSVWDPEKDLKEAMTFPFLPIPPFTAPAGENSDFLLKSKFSERKVGEMLPLPPPVPQNGGPSGPERCRPPSERKHVTSTSLSLSALSKQISSSWE